MEFTHAEEPEPFYIQPPLHGKTLAEHILFRFPVETRERMDEKLARLPAHLYIPDTAADESPFDVAEKYLAYRSYHAFPDRMRGFLFRAYAQICRIPFHRTSAHRFRVAAHVAFYPAQPIEGSRIGADNKFIHTP